MGIIASQGSHAVNFESPLVKDWGDDEKAFTFFINFKTLEKSFRMKSEPEDHIEGDKDLGIIDYLSYEIDALSHVIDFLAYKSGKLMMEFTEFEGFGDSK